MTSALSKSKGVILASAHISNWEITAFAFPFFFGQNMNIIFRTQSDSKVNDKMNEYRSLSGNKMIGTGGELREIFKMLKANEIVAFMVDQSAHPKYSVYSNFFGIETATFAGTAKIALKLDTPVVFGYGIRQPDYSYKIFTDEVKFVPSGENDVEKFTQLIQKKVEDVIREHPGQWLWFHKRFKHRREQS